jgi:peptidoglycan/xylan/chitin deacetylase (PgdA/CDA1 family)
MRAAAAVTDSRFGMKPPFLVPLALAAVGGACGRVPAMARWYTRSDERVLWYHATAEKRIALTIDDGPAATTDSILDVLTRHGAKATFFLIGSRVAGNEEVVRRMIRDGHEVANHMLYDIPSARLAPDTFQLHFARTDSILRSFGVGPVWFRPGSGRFNEAMLEFLCDRGFVGVLGDVYPFDTAIRSAAFAVDFIVERTRPGSIIILHDGHGRGNRTARVLAHALPALAAAGYRVMTLTELVGNAEHSPCESRS